MSSLFAPPELLSAYAMAEDGSGPDLPFGTHLRIFAGFGASFPLAPFAVYKIVSQPSELLDVRVLDREGRPHRDLDLAAWVWPTSSWDSTTTTTGGPSG